MTTAHDGNGFQQKYSTIIQSVTVVALFVAGFWAGVISPLSFRMDKLEQSYLQRNEHTAFQKEMDGRVSGNAAEILLLRRGKVSNESLNKEMHRVDDRFAEFKTEFQTASTNFVPRKELEDKFASINAIFVERRGDIAELRAAVGGFTPLRDTIADLKKQHDELQRQILEIMRK